jgi:hypothetical protein
MTVMPDNISNRVGGNRKVYADKSENSLHRFAKMP